MLESRFCGSLESQFPTRMHRSHSSCSSSSKLTVHCAYSSGAGGKNDGDARVQRALVEMIQIQVNKSRMASFVDERSQYLRDIAQDSRHEYDRIAYRTMKGLDASGSKVLRDLEAGTGLIEQELRLARAELEAQRKAMEESRVWTAQSRNEGLFFKNLYTDGPGNNATRKDLVVSSSSGNFTTSYKQFLSGGVSMVLASFVYSSGSALLTGTFLKPWKLASYGIILTLLLTQMAYVEVLFGDDEDDERRNGPEDGLQPIKSLPLRKDT